MVNTRTPEEEQRIIRAVEELLTLVYQVATIGGHGVDHIKRMVNTARLIVDPREVDPLLLEAAIWLHDLDRTARFNSKPKEELAEFIRVSLLEFGFSEEEIALVIDAVQKHSDLNGDSDSDLLIFLKDCDRLDMGAIGVARTIAHGKGKEEGALPIYVPGDFSKTKPRAALGVSVVRNVRFCLEWQDMLRAPKAKELARAKFAFMQTFIEEVERELKELGII